MSIFDTLAESGVTQEDLEKAASARLFAEAAAAEGIDLSELSEDQAEELYEFWANDGEEKVAGADEFLEAAAAEGIDLSELSEDQVGELYEFWANGGEEKVASVEEMLQEAAVKEASAKLAEAEYIGRYMARVYSDEMYKIAAEGAAPPATPPAAAAAETPAAAAAETSRTRGRGRGAAAATAAGEAAESPKAPKQGFMRGMGQQVGKMTGYTDIREARKGLKEVGTERKTLSEGLKSGKKLNKATLEMLKAKSAPHMQQLGRGVMKGGLTAGALGLGAYGASRMMGGSEEKTSAFDTVVEQRAYEILEALNAPSFDEAIDEAAIDLLRANGYDV